MLTVPLIQAPNQSLTIQANDQIWSLRIKDINGTLCADISLGDSVLVEGQRVVAQQPVIPYGYLSQYGNFIFLTEDDEYPNWELIGVNQQFLFVFPGELPE